MFRFQHKEYILLFAAIALLALVFIVLLQWKKKVRKRIGDKELVNALVKNYAPKLFALKFIFIAAALSMGILAAMNPRKPGGADKESRKGIDIVIALDVSKSMLAADLAPNRLERAKQFINKFIDEMPNDRIALVLFAGKAYLQMPMTVDHGAAKMYVSTAGPDAIPQQGTVVSEALTMSANVFNRADRRFKSVILITDGEDHDEKAISTAKGLAEEGVMVNTIGIGSPEGSTIPDPLTGSDKKDEAGNVIISRLNEEELKEIASLTNGTYTRLQTSDEAIDILQAQLSQIERKAFGDVSQMSFKTFYMWLAGAMFVLLLVEQLIPERKKIKA